MSTDELLSIGYTENEVELIENTSFAELLIERGKLSCEQLLNLGYTVQEIKLLKNYSAGIVPLADADLYALAGVCTGWITATTTSKSEFVLTYWWSWDHCPFVAATDSMAVRWCAYGDDSDFLDVDLTYSSASVTYYKGNQPFDYYTLDPEHSLEFRTLYYTFSVMDPIDRDWWAKEGSIQIFLEKDPSTTRDIHHVKTAGLYGHSVINIGAPSISVSPSDIGFSFSGGLNTDNVAGAKVKVTWDGKITDTVA